MQSKTILVYSEKLNLTVSYEPNRDRFCFSAGYDSRLKGHNFWLVDTEVMDEAVFERLRNFNYNLEVDLSKLEWLKFFTTTQCNLSCGYCIVKNFGFYERREVGREGFCLPSKEMIFEFLNKHKTIRKLLFTGGESLLFWKDIYDIIKEVPDLYVRINTNGILLNDVIVKDILRRGNMCLHISVDIFDKDSDMRIDKGGNGTQELLLRKLDRFVKDYPEFKNYIKLNQLIQPAIKHNIAIDGWKYDVDCSVKVPQRIKFMSDDDIEMLYNIIIKNKDIMIKFAGSKYPVYVWESHWSNPVRKSSWNTELIFMDFDGNLRRCPYISFASRDFDLMKKVVGSYKTGIVYDKMRNVCVEDFEECCALYCKYCGVKSFCDMFRDAYTTVCMGRRDGHDLYCGWIMLCFAFAVWYYLEKWGSDYLAILKHFNDRYSFGIAR
jgi:MoaA/NifB/PqqE/SkfB family radical SAM enzyme